MNISEEFEKVISDAVSETGSEALANMAEVKELAAKLMLDLAFTVGEVGHAEAVLAARDAVMLRGAWAATMTADAADQRIVGAIGATLSLGARMLAAGVAVV